MLEFVGLNYWAIVLVWLIYVVVGAFWYSPAGFAKLWTKYTGIDILKMKQKDATEAIVSVAVSAFVQVLALAILINSLNTNTLTDGLLVGLLAWFGFTSATTVGVTLYSQRSWKFLWLNSSYFLTVMTLGSIILSIWK